MRTLSELKDRNGQVTNRSYERMEEVNGESKTRYSIHDELSLDLNKT